MSWVWRVEALFGAASVAVGVALLFGRTPLSEGYYRSIEAAFFGGAPLPPEAGPLVHWLLATCGAGVIGWGLAWVLIATGPLRRGDPWARRCLGLSLLAWALTDAAAAAAFGVQAELLFVAAAAIAAGVPLALDQARAP